MDRKVDFFLAFVKEYMKKMYDQDLKIVIDDQIGLLGCAGYDSNAQEIKVSSFGFAMGNNNKTAMLQTLFHEIRHKHQHEACEAKDIEAFLQYPEENFLLLKEMVYSLSQEDEVTFYKTNYHNLYTETDANYFGFYAVRNMLLNMLEEYLKYAQEHHIEVSPDFKMKVLKLQKEMIEDSKAEEKDMSERDSFRTNIKDELLGIKVIESTYLEQGEEKDRLIENDRYIKTHPELQLKYPILQLIMDGERPKTYQEIMQQKKELLSKYQGVIPNCIPTRETYQRRIESLFQYIIQTDPMLYIEDLIREQRKDKLQEFLEKHPTLSKVYKKELQELYERTNEEMIKSILDQNKK